MSRAPAFVRFDVDIAEAVAKELGVKLEKVKVDELTRIQCPDFWVGAILYTLTPCIGWYLIFTDIAKGNVAWGIAFLPWVPLFSRDWSQ